jgi:integrase/recombinase XerD
MGKLRDRMNQDMVLRGLSIHTRETYLRCVGVFARHFGRSPSALGGAEL